MEYRILYIEDEKILGKLVQEIMAKAGYKVLLTANGDETVSHYRTFNPHLCLLDIMLPGKDGVEIASQLRKLNSTMPIIFLTAKIQSTDVVAGFNAGCNDYIRKPFSSDELLIRIQYWLNEKYDAVTDDQSDEYSISDIRFYPKKHILETSEGSIALTYKESLLLQILYTNRNSIISRNYILQKIWGNDTMYHSRTLDVYINRLRKYLSKAPSQIITLKGVGYRFVCE